MKNKYFFSLCFLAIFCILYYKFKKFNTILEGVAKCDPNKPKVYSKGGKKSAKTCQKLKESQNEDNMKSFKVQLSDLKKEIKKLWKEYNNLVTKEKENTNNIEETRKSLDCRWKKNHEFLPHERWMGLKYLLKCPAGEKDDDDSDDEVDVGSKQRNAMADANKTAPPKRNIGGMKL